LWAVIFVVVILLWNTINTGRSDEQILTYSEFLDQLDSGSISEIHISGHATEISELKGTLSQSSRFPEQTEFKTQARISDTLQGRIEAQVSSITYEEPRETTLVTMLLGWAPLLVLVGLWIFFMRQMQTGGNRAMSFGKSKAKLISSTDKKVTFKDVAGIEEAKEELLEIVEFLKDPQRFQKLGGKIPKGVLLMGPPGTGKTLLARAISGEANVPFFSISGSDFVEMFVGVGASRVRDLFEQGKKNAPCIIFIDEIDAVGRHRGAGLGGGHDEREQTLNQLLVEMDGFETNEGVILIAASNRPDVLDPALLRPGRFDRRVIVDRPDANGRVGILRVHTKNVPMDDSVDLDILARGTPGMSGADLANLVNEAALVAARRDKKKVQMDDFEFAKDKVLMGVERKSMVLSEEEKELTAFHEAGHAVVAAFSKESDPLHKVTIIPRGRALGLTMQLPVDDMHTYRKSYVKTQIAILMGGRVAEELTQDDVTTGAGNDIDRATDLARQMVCEWGMSELGPVSFGGADEPIFLGRDLAQRTEYSEDTAKQIDAEIRNIVEHGHKTATGILEEHRAVLDRLAQELLENEVMDGSQIYDLIEEMTGQQLTPVVRPIARRPEEDEEEEIEEEIEEESVIESPVAARVSQASESGASGALEDENTGPSETTSSPESPPVSRDAAARDGALQAGESPQEPLPSPKTQG